MINLKVENGTVESEVEGKNESVVKELVYGIGCLVINLTNDSKANIPELKDVSNAEIMNTFYDEIIGKLLFMKKFEISQMFVKKE